MKVICFGDSNTYGYDPRPLDGGRYDASCRWVDILEAQTGWTVCNPGQNGREIPDEPPAFAPDTDLLPEVPVFFHDMLNILGCCAVPTS